MTVDQAIPTGEFKIVQIRGVNEDGTYHRRCICPGDDISAETDEVKAVCEQAHTEEVLSAYNAMLASLES